MATHLTPVCHASRCSASISSTVVDSGTLTVLEIEPLMKGYHDYVDYGRREIYTIEA